jgi:TctA family transporter
MAQRASTRRSVQIVVAVSVAFVLGLSVFNRDFVEPYGTPVGQLVLLCVCGLFALGFWWLRKLSTIETPERFLVRSDSGVRFVRPRTAASNRPQTAGQAPAAVQSQPYPGQQGEGEGVRR